jgi:predicted oxidoreductase
LGKAGRGEGREKRSECGFQAEFTHGGLFPVEVPPIQRRIRVVSMKTEAEP